MDLGYSFLRSRGVGQCGQPSPCLRAACLHGGRCLPLPDGAAHRCLCPPGFGGECRRGHVGVCAPCVRAGRARVLCTRVLRTCAGVCCACVCTVGAACACVCAAQACALYVHVGCVCMCTICASLCAVHACVLRVCCACMCAVHAHMSTVHRCAVHCAFAGRVCAVRACVLYIRV